MDNVQETSLQKKNVLPLNCSTLEDHLDLMTYYTMQPFNT